MKNNESFGFSEKFEKWPILTKIWPTFGWPFRQAGNKKFSSKIKKNIFLKTLIKCLKCLKRRFFAFFSRKKLKILYFIIILVEIWLVEVGVGVCDLLSYSY